MNEPANDNASESAVESVEASRSTRLAVVSILLITLLMLGSQLRFQQLTRPVVWNDEALTMEHVAGHGTPSRSALANRVTTARDVKEILQSPTSGNGLKGIVTSLTQMDPNHGPLNYFIVWIWGQAYGEHTYAQLRMPEALFGTLSILAAFWLGLELTGAIECAFLLALFVTLSPMSLHHSREIREYSLYFLMLFLTSASFLRAYRTDNLRDWIWYTIILTVGLYAHIMVALLAVSNVIYAVIDAKGKFLAGRPLRTLLFSFVAAILFSPWLSIFFGNLEAAESASKWLSKRIPLEELMKAWIACPVAMFVYIPTFDLGKALIYPFFAVLIFCAFYVCRTRKDVAKYLIVTFVIGAGTMFAHDAILGGIRSTFPNYVAVAPIMGVTVIGIGLWQLFQSSRGSLKILAVVMALGVLGAEGFLAANRLVDPEPTTMGPVKLHEIADLLNTKDRPLLVSMEGPTWVNFTQVLSLSHVLKPDTRILWFDDKPNLSLLPEDCKSFYLYDPPDRLKEAAEKAGFTVQPTSTVGLVQAFKT